MHAPATSHAGFARRAAPGVFTVVAASTLIAAGNAGVSISRVREVVKNLGRSVVNVQVIGREAGQQVALASFSGFTLSGEQDLILACYAGLRELLKGRHGRVKVTYDDMWQGEGSLLASDEPTGLCLIRCAGHPKPPPGVALAPAAHLVRGASVLTVANPYGIQHSARFGLIHGPACGGAKAPCLAIRLGLDAARGREGGVACDLNGHMGGVVLPLETPADLGAAYGTVGSPALPQAKVLPTRAVALVLLHLKEKRRVLRGWIGAGFTVCRDPERQTCFVKVNKVEAAGPAARAGLNEDDVVVKANDTAFTSLNDLYDLAFWVEYEGLGKDLRLTVGRGGGLTATVVIPVELKPRQ
jgi:S1-C subfamily serine protease